MFCIAVMVMALCSTCAEYEYQNTEYELISVRVTHINWIDDHYARVTWLYNYTQNVDVRAYKNHFIWDRRKHGTWVTRKTQVYQNEGLPTEERIEELETTDNRTFQQIIYDHTMRS